MRLLEVDLREERLVRLEVRPVVRVERLAVVGEVPVGLARADDVDVLGKRPDVGREVARVAEPVGSDLDAVGEPVAVVAVRAVVVGADGRLIHARS